MYMYYFVNTPARGNAVISWSTERHVNVACVFPNESVWLVPGTYNEKD